MTMTTPAPGIFVAVKAAERAEIVVGCPLVEAECPQGLEDYLPVEAGYPEGLEDYRPVEGGYLEGQVDYLPVEAGYPEVAAGYRAAEADSPGAVVEEVAEGEFPPAVAQAQKK
jgi:hypothetical protein